MHLVINIGCIECGVSSNIVGMFATKDEADRVCEICNEKYEWRNGGQNNFEVFDLPPVGVVHADYPEASNLASPAAERGEVRCDGRVGCTTSNGEKK